jgi:hypothetical protein
MTPLSLKAAAALSRPMPGSKRVALGVRNTAL